MGLTWRCLGGRESRSWVVAPDLGPVIWGCHCGNCEYLSPTPSHTPCAWPVGALRGACEDLLSRAVDPWGEVIDEAKCMARLWVVPTGHLHPHPQMVFANKPCNAPTPAWHLCTLWSLSPLALACWQLLIKLSPCTLNHLWSPGRPWPFSTPLPYFHGDSGSFPPPQEGDPVGC